MTFILFCSYICYANKSTQLYNENLYRFCQPCSFPLITRTNLQFAAGILILLFLPQVMAYYFGWIDRWDKSVYIHSSTWMSSIEALHDHMSCSHVKRQSNGTLFPPGKNILCSFNIHIICIYIYNNLLYNNLLIQYYKY